MGINKSIILEDKKSYNTHILSAHIKADSFVYGLFNRNYHLHKVVEFSDVKSLSDVETIIREVKEYNNIIKVASYGGKPFLHSSDYHDELVQYIPSFDNKSIYSDTLTGYPVYTNYGVTDNMDKFFVSDIFTKEAVHISNLLAFNLYPNIANQVSIHLEKNNIHITYLNSEHFLFYNQFRCEGNEDFLYRILQVYKALKLDTHTVGLSVSGQITSGSELYELLYKYFGFIAFNGKGEYTIHDTRYSGDEHVFYDLYNIAKYGNS